MLGPHLALVAPPLVLLTAVLAWLARSLPLPRRVLAVAGWGTFVWLTFFTGCRPAAAVMIVGAPDSDELWTFTLQSPQQRIERHQPIGSFASDAILVARYVWDRAAAAQVPPGAVVNAKLNGTPLPPATAAEDPAEYWCCSLRWHVPAAVVRAAPIASIEIWLPVRDPRVRFVAQRSTAAAALREAGSLFFDGAVLRPGVPHTHRGEVEAGFPHVWLEPAP